MRIVSVARATLLLQSPQPALLHPSAHSVYSLCLNLCSLDSPVSGFRSVYEISPSEATVDSSPKWAECVWTLAYGEILT